MSEYIKENDDFEMKSKKSRKPKVVEFKADATDGDGDGYVQDATIWERPLQELVEEVIEEAIEETKETSYVATTGETYLSIALKFNGGTDYAKEIRAKNNNKAIRTGVIINL
jgi:hypothetical protein